MFKRKSMWAEQGVYEFRRLSLMGFDNTDPEIKKLQGLGYKVRAFLVISFRRFWIDLVVNLTFDFKILGLLSNFFKVVGIKFVSGLWKMLLYH